MFNTLKLPYSTGTVTIFLLVSRHRHFRILQKFLGKLDDCVYHQNKWRPAREKTRGIERVRKSLGSWVLVRRTCIAFLNANSHLLEVKAHAKPDSTLAVGPGRDQKILPSQDLSGGRRRTVVTERRKVDEFGSEVENRRI